MNTQFHYACINEDYEQLDSLLDQGVHIDCYRAYNDHNTPLLYAIECDRPILVDFLLERNASVHKMNNTGHTPLSLAVIRHRVECISLLLNYHADIDKVAINCTPLMYASSRNYLDIVTLLIKRGANVNIEYGGFTALMCAIEHGRWRCTKIIQYLLKSGARITTNTMTIVKRRSVLEVISAFARLRHMANQIGSWWLKRTYYKQLYDHTKLPTDLIKEIVQCRIK